MSYGCLRVTYECLTDILCMSYGCLTGVLLASYGYPVGVLRVSCSPLRCSMDVLLVSYGCLSCILRMFIGIYDVRHVDVLHVSYMYYVSRVGVGMNMSARGGKKCKVL